MKRVYFIGIGGIGMSALARYFKAQKWVVSGSDSMAGQITEGLKKDGIKAKIGQKKGNLPLKLDLVITSQAINKNNPELIEAKARGIRILTYPEAIGELSEQYRTIAISGSHGKSTTTALAALILIKASLDPTVIVGTNLREFGGKNFRAGGTKKIDKRRGGLLVLEADEFGDAFSHYSPSIAAITNIDKEHLDTYGDLRGVKNAFINFLENVGSGGALVLNRDDKNLFSLRAEISSIAKLKNLRVIWHSNSGKTAAKIRRVIKIPGEHNVSDAIASYKIARVLEVPHKTILSAIGAYRGAWRRMEYKGKLSSGARSSKNNTLVFDDYAHHPTEIKATLKAFKEKYPGRKILCIFQPHLSKRLESLFKEFTTAFDDADELIILPIYKVQGRHTKPGKYDSKKLVSAIKKKYPKKYVLYINNLRDLKNAVLKIDTTAKIDTKRVMVMMGAGNIVDMTPALLSRRTSIL